MDLDNRPDDASEGIDVDPKSRTLFESDRDDTDDDASKVAEKETPARRPYARKAPRVQDGQPPKSMPQKKLGTQTGGYRRGATSKSALVRRKALTIRKTASGRTVNT